MSTESDPNELFFPEYLQHLLDEIAVREGFAAGYTIETKTGSNLGDGFQSVMLRTVIVGKRHQNDNERLELVSKVPPALEVRRNLAAPSFRQEILAYEKILPTLVGLQKNRQISDADGFYSIPKCYGTYSNKDTNEFAIVLEDLRPRGFRMWNKFDSIDFSHMKLVMAEMGKYHALSFALRERNPELLKQYAEQCGGVYKAIAEYPQADAYYEKAFDRAIGVLQDEDSALIKKVEKVRDSFRNILRAVGTGELAEPFAVLNHGDFWNNNMMFDYHSSNGTVAKSVFIIDWQLGQYASPITDLTYYMFSSTEHGLRAQHWDIMLAIYHRSLTTLLSQLGCDAKNLFGYDDFVDQLKNFALYGIIMAPVLVPFLTLRPDDVPDLDKANFDAPETIEFVSKNSTLFDVRMREILRDFDTRGFFESKFNI